MIAGGWATPPVALGGRVTVLQSRPAGAPCPMAGFRRGQVLPAGVPEPAPQVILPGAYQLRPSATFAVEGPEVPARTPTRVVRLTDQMQWAANGRPVILAEVEVWSDPAGSRRRGFAPLALSDFAPAEGTTQALLTDLLGAFGRAAARLGPPPPLGAAPRPVAPSAPVAVALNIPVWTPPPAVQSPAATATSGAWVPPSAPTNVALQPVTPMGVTLSLQQPVTAAVSGGLSPVAIVALVAGGGGLVALILYLLRRGRR